MKVYLAARYSRRLELCGYRAELEANGCSVTSRWLNGKHQIGNDGTPIGDAGEALVEADKPGAPEAAAALREAFCQEDLADVLAAQTVISFTEIPRQPTTNRGGRHVEFGIALAQAVLGAEVRLIVVGPRENIFHHHPMVEQFDTWEEARQAIGVWVPIARHARSGGR